MKNAPTKDSLKKIRRQFNFNSGVRQYVKHLKNRKPNEFTNLIIFEIYTKSHLPVLGCSFFFTPKTTSRFLITAKSKFIKPNIIIFSVSFENIF